MSKYTTAEKLQIQSLVTNLTIKRIPDAEIIIEVFNQTGKTLSRSGLYDIRQRIKRDSFKWYQRLKQGEFEYLYEFKERINEIADLQKRHYNIIEGNQNNPS